MAFGAFLRSFFYYSLGRNFKQRSEPVCVGDFFLPGTDVQGVPKRGGFGDTKKITFSSIFLLGYQVYFFI